MLYCWLQPEAEDKVPRFATHQVGCAGWVTNARGELLVVREWRDADAAAVAAGAPARAPSEQWKPQPWPA